MLPHIDWIERTMLPTAITITLWLTWIAAYFGVAFGAGLGWVLGTKLMNWATRGIG